MPDSATPSVLTRSDQLTKHFDTHSQLLVRGTSLLYITGEQTTTRLNEVYGPEGWDFIIDQFFEVPNAWVVIATLVVRSDNFAGAAACRKQHFGYQDKSGQADGYKAAATDALKKCATLLGIGLYLFDAAERLVVEQEMRENGTYTAPPVSNQGQQRPQYNQNQYQQAPVQTNQPQTRIQNGPLPACEHCGNPIESVEFKDGTVRTPAEIAGWGRKNFNKALCMEDYRAAKSNPSFLNQGDGSNDGDPSGMPF